VRREAMEGMAEAVEELDRAVTRDAKGGRWARGAGGRWAMVEAGEEEKDPRRERGWAGRLRAARGALVDAGDGREPSGEGWLAVRRLLAGVMAAPASTEEWGEKEGKRRARAAAEAIGAMQDAAAGMLVAWRAGTVAARGEYAKWVETARWGEEQQRGWRMKRKLGGAVAVKVERRAGEHWR